MQEEECRFTRIFHTIVAILLLLGGGAVLGFGIWLFVSGNGSTSHLHYRDGDSFRLWLSTSKLSIGIGVFLLLTAMASLIALTRRFVGKTFRTIYTIMGITVLLALITICGVSVVILRRCEDGDVRTFLQDAWVETAKDDRATICKVEKSLQCRGFNTDGCKACIGIEQECSIDECASCGISRPTGVGCYEMFLKRLSSLFLPTAIISGLLAFIVLLDTFFACCL